MNSSMGLNGMFSALEVSFEMPVDGVETILEAGDIGWRAAQEALFASARAYTRSLRL